MRAASSIAFSEAEFFAVYSSGKTTEEEDRSISVACMSEIDFVDFKGRETDDCCPSFSMSNKLANANGRFETNRLIHGLCLCVE